LPPAAGTRGKRRTLRIKDKEVVGYEVKLEGLTVAESLNIQEQGLGGRRHMGCGVFVPMDRCKGDNHE
jgi:CRISPR-associated protein Cas6